MDPQQQQQIQALVRSIITPHDFFQDAVLALNSVALIAHFLWHRWKAHHE